MTALSLVEKDIPACKCLGCKRLTATMNAVNTGGCTEDCRVCRGIGGKGRGDFQAKGTACAKTLRDGRSGWLSCQESGSAW